jgi:uncharacterized protein YycO
MKILAYHGKSIISKLIRFQTRSQYSHIAFELPDGTVIEAGISRGVSHSESFRTLHKPGTKVEVFNVGVDLRVNHEVNFDKAKEFALAQVGKPYDFRSVFRFVSRVPATENGKWFCSELAEKALEAGGVELLRGEAHNHSPRDICMSPVLTLAEVRTV